MKTTRQIIVENISSRMHLKRLKQFQLAKLAKMDKVALNRILNGKRGAGPKTLENLAVALDCTVFDLQRPADYIPDKEPHSKASRNDTIASIVTLLPALDDGQLSDILGQVEAASLLNTPAMKTK